MISKDGAILIATLLPIVVFLLAFESRSLLRAARPQKMVGRWVFVYVLTVVLGSALTAVDMCVGAVAAGETLDGWKAVFVGWTASAIGLLTGFAIGGSLAVTVFTDDDE